MNTNIFPPHVRATERRAPASFPGLFFLILLFFAPVFSLSAQTGWDYIRENDFAGAKIAFQQSLQQNGPEESTLVGLLFIAETLRDEAAYRQYAGQLLSSGWPPHYVWLFDHLHAGKPEEALRQPLHFSLKIPFIEVLADSLFRIRRFEESESWKNRIAPTWNWDIVGPFTNVGGSGFVEITPVENSSFSRTDTFKNENGQTLYWIRQPQVRPGAGVSFDALPAGQEANVYYANSFFNVPETLEAELMISRKQPIKIWLDDRLILSLDRPDAGLRETERLRCTLAQGPHRLLVKIADFPEEIAPDRLAFLDSRTRSGEQSWDDTGEATGISEIEAAFFLRFADPATGETLDQIRPAPESPYPAGAGANPVFERQPFLQYFLDRAATQPEKWENLYLLSKSFAKYAELEEGEAYFAAWRREYPQAAFGKFILAKFYDANDKGDRAEALLSEMDTIRTPTFAEYLFRLEKIDPDNNEPEYVAAMEKILTLSPTNLGMLTRYLQFLQESGRKEALQAYVRRFFEKYRSPYWEKTLGVYLEADSYKPESDETPTERELTRDFKQALKDTRKRFLVSDYETMLAYYRLKERETEVLKTYDELIRTLPDGDFAFRKARYLFERGRNREAIEQLRALTARFPFNSSYCETIGDIYIEEKNEREALAWYRRAVALDGGYLSYQVAEKIEKIEPKPSDTRYFSTIDLLTLARDTTGAEAYAAEESYVQLFSQQIWYDPRQQAVESVRKLIVRINSETGARYWTEADLQLMGEITSARVLKRDGTVSSPNVGWGMAVFKNLQAGDVILVEGGGRQDMPSHIPGELMYIAPVSWPVPVAQASMELVLPDTQPAYFAANRLAAQPTMQLDTPGIKILRWDWRNLAKLEDEDAAPDNYDAMAWLMIGSAADWSKVAQWYERLTYGRTDLNYELREKARALIQPGMQAEEIVAVLHQFITREINYSYVPFMNSNYVPKKAGATLAGKIGDCKDVATLMIALLREYGIPAWHALVSTHQFSRVEPRPALYIFNHAIVAYELPDGVLRYADLTTDYFPTGILPTNDCDAWALVIRPGEKNLRRLPNQQLDTALTRIDIKGRGRIVDGDLLLDVQASLRGVVAGGWREVLLGASPEDRHKELSDYFAGGALSHTELEDIQFTAMDDVEAPLLLSMRLKAYQIFDQVLQFQIMPLPLPMSLRPEKTLFAARRYNDLDIDALLELAPIFETIDLELPAGRQLAEMPPDRSVESPFGRYELRFTALPDGLRVERRLVFHRRFIKYAEFEAFKQFYRTILNGDGGMVVLK
jgi:tetratricopeptide (TPR) repeat protein